MKFSTLVLCLSSAGCSLLDPARHVGEDSGAIVDSGTDAATDGAIGDGASDGSNLDAADALVSDAGSEDAASSDAGADDASVNDASVNDGGAGDAGQGDAGTATPLAFPGALGFGTQSVGGRGGRVIEVTNLNASGTGSFAAAVQASGPRIVVFRVGGIIDLTAPLTISQPFLTVAGQTGIGNGVVIRGAPLDIRTHDVVLRGLRVRPGDQVAGSNLQYRGAWVIGCDPATDCAAERIVIDHCSFSWNLSPAWIQNATDITISWSIFSEALACSTNPGAAGCVDDLGTGTQHEMHRSFGLQSSPTGLGRISMHHNFFAHNAGSNPEFRGGVVEFVDNIVYDWGYLGTFGDSGGTWHFVGNQFLPGETTTLYYADGHGIDEAAVFSGVTLFARNNARTVMGEVQFDNFVRHTGTALTVPTDAMSTQLTRTAAARTTSNTELEWRRTARDEGLGAQPQDSTDRRVIRDSINFSGRWRSTAVASEWDFYESTLSGAPLDADHDGMPNAWEAEHGLNLNTASDGPLDRDSDGVTNVEEYLNSLLPGQ